MKKRLLACLLALCLALPVVAVAEDFDCIEEVFSDFEVMPIDEIPEVEPDDFDIPEAAESETVPAAFEAEEPVLTAKDADPVDSGRCGADVFWTLDENGVLTIRGSGAMYDYDFDSFDDEPDVVHTNYAPWASSAYDQIEVVIEPGVTRIGAGAFFNQNFSAVSVPDTVTAIGDGAFAQLWNLASVTLPNGLKTIGDEAFSNAQSLSEINIPDTVASIGAYAFAFTNIETIFIPAGLRDFAQAFSYCKTLNDVTFAQGLSLIDRQAFYMCEKLETVVIPGSVESVAGNAFAHCAALTGVAFENGAETIASRAFAYCPNLSALTLPDSLKKVELQAFLACKSLASVTIPRGIAEIGECAFGFTAEGNNTPIPLPGFSLNGYCSSVAAAYAKKNDIPFTTLGEHTVQTVTALKPTSVTPGKTCRACVICGTVMSDYSPIPVLGIYPAAIKIGVGESYYPSIVGTESKYFKTSNIGVAGLNASGVIKGKKAGYATVTVTANNGFKQTVKVTVGKPVTKITLNKKSAKMKKGKTLQLKATVKGTSYKRSWSSSNKKVATVDQKGRVKAVGKGKATITVKTYNGKKATCKITVS